MEWQGKRIVTGHGDGSVKVWKAKTGSLRTSIKAHSAYAHASISPVKPHDIVSGGFDSHVQLWTLDGQHKSTPDEHTYPITSVRFSRDGQLIARGTQDGTVAVQYPDGHMRQFTPQHSRAVGVVEFSQDGTRLVSGANDSLIALWLVSNGELLSVMRDHTKEVTCLAFLGELHDEIFVSGGRDSIMNVWNEGGKIQSLPTPQPIYSMCASPDRRHLVVGYANGTVQCFDLALPARLL